MVPSLLGPSARGAVTKLPPARLTRNPVIFVTAVVAALATLYAAAGLGADCGLLVQIALWLWATALFANFAEAMAEGRGKARADSLRATQGETLAKRVASVEAAGEPERVSSRGLRPGDLVVVEAGDVIPADGEVVEGVASVDESAITGESAPVIRKSGGDRSAVTGGTRVVSDHLIVRVSQAPGEGFLDRMIAVVEGGRPAQDAERGGALDPAGRTDHRLRPGRGDA